MSVVEIKPEKGVDFVEIAARIVASYVQHNPLPVAQLPETLREIHAAIREIANGRSPSTEHRPAVSIKKSVTADYLICLEDGRRLKMLKRYLKAKYGLSPQEYRAKWGLPIDYPMVAPSYSEQRSQFAKHIGLGRQPVATTKKRGRRPKTKPRV